MTGCPKTRCAMTGPRKSSRKHADSSIPKPDGEGFEPPAPNTGEMQSGPQGGAESGAVGARNHAPDPDLARLIEAWPTMTADARRRVLEIVAEDSPPEPEPPDPLSLPSSVQRGTQV